MKISCTWKKSSLSVRCQKANSRAGSVTILGDFHSFQKGAHPVFCVQEANSRAVSNSPDKTVKHSVGAAPANSQQQVKKRNTAVKRKLQEDVASQASLIEQLQRELNTLREANVRRQRTCSTPDPDAGKCHNDCGVAVIALWMQCCSSISHVSGAVSPSFS